MGKKIKNLLTVLIAATIAFAFTSCGNKHEKALKQQINLMNDYADEFDKDPKSPKLAKLDEKVHDAGERMKSLKDMSEADGRKLMNEYGKELGEASARYMKAKMGSAIGDMGKVLEGFDLEGFGK